MNIFGTNYGMYTTEGNQVIANIVNGCLMIPVAEDRWPAAHKALVDVSKDERFAEATDTAVREAVYHAVGNVGNFYI